MLHRWWPSWVDWMLLVAWMALIYYFSNQLHPQVPAVEIWVIRKTMHVIEYTLLFVLWWRALRSTGRMAPHAILRWAFMATLLYAASDELHQHFVGRDGNVLDVLIDSAVPCFVWFRSAARQKNLRLHPSRPPAE
jgi:VanZ family protein